VGTRYNEIRPVRPTEGGYGPMKEATAKSRGLRGEELEIFLRATRSIWIAFRTKLSRPSF